MPHSLLTDYINIIMSSDIYLCNPEHSIQSNMPKLMLAHFGYGEEQSAHFSFPGVSKKSCPTELLLKYGVTHYVVCVSLQGIER